MSERNLVVTSAEGLPEGTIKKTQEINPLPGNKPSNTDPTTDTASAPNALKRGVEVGLKPIIKTARHDSLDSLRSVEG